MFQGNPYVPVLALPLFVSILRSPSLSEALKNVVGMLDEKIIPIEQHVIELAALSEKELGKELPKLDEPPFADRLPIKRLIAEYRGQMPQKN